MITHHIPSYPINHEELLKSPDTRTRDRHGIPVVPPWPGRKSHAAAQWRRPAGRVRQRRHLRPGILGELRAR